jgi:DDB1- and CUL4-associated factor 7
MYGTPTSAVPGSLQPAAGQQRPAPPAQPAHTAPSNVPTVPHINTNAQQYTLPTRSNTMSQFNPSGSHSYSRSSPAGLQEHQKYIPFSASSASNTPGSDMPGGPMQPKYPQTPQQKYYTSSTPSGGGPAQSPLALEQIRPRANSSLNDEGNMFGDLQSTNSNYMAPWAVFAFDWCKYPMLNSNSAGKMAIGSYLEDPHNFVRGICDAATSYANYCRFKF